jgi:hypothetical protein
VDSSLAAAGNYAPAFAQFAAAMIDFLCENTDDQIICEKRINAEPNLGASHKATVEPTEQAQDTEKNTASEATAEKPLSQEILYTSDCQRKNI